MITQVTIDSLRAHVRDFGPRSLLDAIAIICEETAAGTRKEPEHTAASTNAIVIRDAISRLV